MPVVQLKLVLESASGTKIYARRLPLQDVPRVGDKFLVEAPAKATIIPTVNEVIWQDNGEPPLVVLGMGRRVIAVELEAVEASGWARAALWEAV